MNTSVIESNKISTEIVQDNYRKKNNVIFIFTCIKITASQWKKAMKTS